MEKQVHPQRYQKASSTTHDCYESAAEDKDSRKLAEDEKVRIRRRANGTFDVVLYRLCKVSTPS